MKKTAGVVLAVFFLSMISVCAETKPRIAPPPLRVEAIKIGPTPNHVWVAGYWKWAGVNYVWVEGRWVKPKPGRVWVSGTWALKGSFWVWTSGRWEKVKKDEPKQGKKKKK
jgi:hypothetical protein